MVELLNCWMIEWLNDGDDNDDDGDDGDGNDGDGDDHGDGGGDDHGDGGGGDDDGDEVKKITSHDSLCQHGK